MKKCVLDIFNKYQKIVNKLINNINLQLIIFFSKKEKRHLGVAVLYFFVKLICFSKEDNLLRFFATHRANVIKFNLVKW